MFTLPQRLQPIVDETRRVSTADPFLISGAIAYNVFFALIPLAFAAVAAFSMLASGTDVLAWIQELVVRGAPSEVVDFFAGTIDDALQAVEGMGTIVVVLSLLVALWSGSRAIYAVQKALRLIEGVEEHRAYWQARGLGILLTVGAGVALIVAYVVLLFGGWVMEILNGLGVAVAPATLISGAVIVAWVSAVLFAVYRWGISVPVHRPVISAVSATITLILVTWVGAVLVPTYGGGTVEVLGTVGVILVWSYVIGFIVIVTPSVVAAAEVIIRGPTP